MVTLVLCFSFFFPFIFFRGFGRGNWIHLLRVSEQPSFFSFLVFFFLLCFFTIRFFFFLTPRNRKKFLSIYHNDYIETKTQKMALNKWRRFLHELKIQERVVVQRD